MTKCAIQVCRNYKGRIKTTGVVTFHRLPTDPILKSKWIEIIKRSRRDELWKPVKSTVVCSDHFRKKDMYYVGTQKRRRLSRKAVPFRAVYLASEELNDVDDDDDSEDLMEDAGNKSYRPSTPDVAAVYLASEQLNSDDDDASEDLMEAAGNKSHRPSTPDIADNAESERNDFFADSTDIQTKKASDQLPKITDLACTSNSLPEQTTGACMEFGQNKEDIPENFSDLESIFDAPETSKLRRELQRRICLQKKHTLKIKSLKRQNLRLMKKIVSLKKMVATLKKRKVYRQ